MDTPRIIISISGGVVQGVRSNVPVQVDVLDYDNLSDCDCTDEEKRQYESLEQEFESLPEAAY